MRRHRERVSLDIRDPNQKALLDVAKTLIHEWQPTRERLDATEIRETNAKIAAFNRRQAEKYSGARGFWLRYRRAVLRAGRAFMKAARQ